MANFQTKIVLVGAVTMLASIESLVSTQSVVVVGDDVVVNPTATNEVVLQSYNDDVLLALANMSDVEHGVPGEYFTKIGGDTTNFTAQKIYKALKGIDNPKSLIGNDGEPHRPKGTETGTIFFRKSTVAEIIKRLSSVEGADFTIGGTPCLLDAFVQVSKQKFDGNFDGNLTPAKTGLVVSTSEKSTHYQLPDDWDKAMTVVRALKPASLPVINGYEGKIEGEFLVYDCARIPLAYFAKYEGATRRIKSIELSSEVVIDADAFEAIVEFLG